LRPYKVIFAAKEPSKDVTLEKVRSITTSAVEYFGDSSTKITTPSKGIVKVPAATGAFCLPAMDTNE